MAILPLIVPSVRSRACAITPTSSPLAETRRWHQRGKNLPLTRRGGKQLVGGKEETRLRDERKRLALMPAGMST